MTKVVRVDVEDAEQVLAAAGAEHSDVALASAVTEKRATSRTRRPV